MKIEHSSGVDRVLIDTEEQTVLFQSGHGLEATLPLSEVLSQHEDGVMLVEDRSGLTAEFDVEPIVKALA
jgi:hypothetical protein